MAALEKGLQYWKAPRDWGSDELELLQLMGRPTRIEIPGRDTSRCRVLVTLLHGNEPSGLRAMRQLLLEDCKPAVTLYCYVIAITEALTMPQFSHRQLPGKRDYNRCFRPPFDNDEQGRFCDCLLQEIKALQPEAVVDMHNTSGAGPDFGVTTSYATSHDDIVSLFTPRLIVTSLRLGALMETNSESIPVVTIECGGANSVKADQMAYAGLQKYFTTDNLTDNKATNSGLDVYYSPLRIEMHEATTIAYGNSFVPGTDITLKTDIDRHNFDLVTPDTLLGWVNDTAMNSMAAFDATRSNHFKEFYRSENGVLFPRFRQKMFMITRNASIATSDCLWYVVPE